MKPKVKSNYKDRIIALAVILIGILALSFTYKANMESISSKSELFKPNTTKSVSELNIPANTTTVVKKDTIIKSIKHSHKVEHDSMHDLDINGNTITVTNKTNGKKEEMKFTLNNGKVSELYIDGKEIPEKDYDKYQDKIDDTIVDLKEAMKDIEELDIENIKLEIEEAMKDVHIDVDKIEEDIARAMESINEIDMENIMQNIEINLDHLKDFDFDSEFYFSKGNLQKIEEKLDNRLENEIEREVLKELAKEFRKDLDTEAFKEEMRKVHEEFSKIHEEEIKIQLEESLKHIEEIDKKKIEKDLQEKLEELEALELEEK